MAKQGSEKPESQWRKSEEIPRRVEPGFNLVEGPAEGLVGTSPEGNGKPFTQEWERWYNQASTFRKCSCCYIEKKNREGQGESVGSAKGFIQWDKMVT